MAQEYTRLLPLICLLENAELNVDFYDLMRRVSKRKAEKQRKSVKAIITDVLLQPEMHRIVKNTYLT